jgi:hypothetical protein
MTSLQSVGWLKPVSTALPVDHRPKEVGARARLRQAAAHLPDMDRCLLLPECDQVLGEVLPASIQRLVRWHLRPAALRAHVKREGPLSEAVEGHRDELARGCHLAMDTVPGSEGRRATRGPATPAEHMPGQGLPLALQLGHQGRGAVSVNVDVA